MNKLYQSQSSFPVINSSPLQFPVVQTSSYKEMGDLAEAVNNEALFQGDLYAQLSDLESQIQTIERSPPYSLNASNLELLSDLRKLRGEMLATLNARESLNAALLREVGSINSSLDQVESLLKEGAQPNIVTEQGQLPLIQALKLGNSEAALLLLKYQADPLLKDALGSSAFSQLMQNFEASLFEEMVHRSGVSLEEVLASANREGETLIYRAVKEAAFSFLRYLQEKNIAINIKNQQGEQGPLHAWVLGRGDPDLLNLLIEMRININSRDSEKATPLTLALSLQRVEKAILLLKEGAEIDASSIKMALQCPRLDKLWAHQFLNSTDFPVSSFSKLEFAIKFRMIEEIKTLLKRGAIPDETDSYGKTLLDNAWSMRDLEISFLLLEFSADVSKIRANTSFEKSFLQIYQSHFTIQERYTALKTLLVSNTTKQVGYLCQNHFKEILAHIEHHYAVSPLLRRAVKK